MNAKIFTDTHGYTIIGKHIFTEAIGEYPGGVAEVIALYPDKKAPEIVLQVKHPTFGEIGIFEHESVNFA
jgi:hypothetical protein